MSEALDTKLLEVCKQRPTDATLLPVRRAIIAKLLADGAAPSAHDAHGRTPLWWAAAYLDRACCELLLDAGATDRADAENKTALQSAVEHGNLETTLLLLDRGGTATEKLVALADRRFYMKLAAELRKRVGLADPFRDDPRAAMIIFAKQLEFHARTSAEASGDLAHYEEREDLEPADLMFEYWLGHYKSLAREELDALDEAERAALPEREAMLEELYDAYRTGYDSASGS